MNEEKVDIRTPEYVSLQFKVAGLGSRSAAFIIDYLIIQVVSIVLLLLAFFIIRDQSGGLFTMDLSGTTIAIAIIVLFILNWGYFFAFEFFSGGKTLGKSIIGIRTIQENGHSVTLLSAFIRNLLRIIDSLPASYFLGIVMVFFHPKHKRIGDLVAGTIVIHERKRKSKKRVSVVDREISKRGLSREDLVIDDIKLQTFGTKEWHLIKKYCNRMLTVTPIERKDLTRQVANVLFPKIDLDVEGKTETELENTLLVLFLKLKDEWEYEW